jgi:hypothetical protein
MKGRSHIQSSEFAGIDAYINTTAYSNSRFAGLEVDLLLKFCEQWGLEPEIFAVRHSGQAQQLR